MLTTERRYSHEIIQAFFLGSGNVAKFEIIEKVKGAKVQLQHIEKDLEEVEWNGLGEESVEESLIIG